ncbi:calcium/sodium antiporter [Sedimenticola selenatireducens]|uniref:Calcium/sodium antiporter n=1 Tax=Sedimenticola selenatireducens TaxID=191960 RepID=A0A557S0J0_9GAMM|nr:calcium/sodium antiporter [Sedimenticola selenatireducens]TVO70858.1 calcium/sodium antiporter [Sedimenticola selenatireducens]TVT65778.1 MAG: calcium/sodium antiporter [Sedimenticola selenatireducens]
MLLEILAIIAGFALLVWGADKFVSGASSIANNLGLPPMIIGLTIVGFGTSAPEVLVSTMAAIQGNSGLAIGNALGSNIANIGFILGCTALIAPLCVRSETLRREYPMLLAVCLGTLVLLLDGILGVSDGLILLVGLVAMLFAMVRISMRSLASDPMNAEIIAEMPETMSTGKAVFSFTLGLALLLFSSRILVWGAVNIATAYGVSDLVIGLTIVALGTSLPELAASIMSALKNEHDIAIGNVLGSNMYNLLAVLAMPGLIAPGAFDPMVLSRDMPVMIGLTLALFVMGYGFGSAGRINRFEGLLLILAFVGYQAVLFMQAKEVPVQAPTAYYQTAEQHYI